MKWEGRRFDQKRQPWPHNSMPIFAIFLFTYLWILAITTENSVFGTKKISFVFILFCIFIDLRIYCFKHIIPRYDATQIMRFFFHNCLYTLHTVYPNGFLHGLWKNATMSCNHAKIKVLRWLLRYPYAIFEERYSSFSL